VNWYELFAGTLTGAGLIGSVVAGTAYQLRSKGSWRRYPEGRWFMTFFTSMGTLFAYVFSVQIFGDWAGRRVTGIVLYTALIGLVWGAVRLLFTARDGVGRGVEGD
jgi:hypothetical protein